MTGARWSVYEGDCLDWLRSLPDDSVDAVVTDPPYGLSSKVPDMAEVLTAWLAGDAYDHGGGGFMGAAWDSFVPGPRVWREVLRVLKPGGHAVVFAGTRTVDLMGVACRIAGFEVRDMGRWAYWNGFPKGGDIGAHIDRMAGAEREVVGEEMTGNARTGAGWEGGKVLVNITAPATPEAVKWDGWKTGLKPAGEPWLLIRKPLAERTIARQVLATGTGAINIDGTRYPEGDKAWPGPQAGRTTTREGNAFSQDGSYAPGAKAAEYQINGGHPDGRYPANLYYCPKASRKERERGCDSIPLTSSADLVNRAEGSAGKANPRAGAGGMGNGRRNKHSTVKPAEVMRWLCRLVTPPGGLVIDPFTGSGTTGIAATLDGFRFAGAELDPSHVEIAKARIAHAVAHPEQWADTAPGSRIAKPPRVAEGPVDDADGTRQAERDAEGWQVAMGFGAQPRE